ncbi:MAG: S8 family serine peptidase, partial [Acidobacteria bacterium]|nr:S8 family serine peptidase [Acidobacteriota bacterium]
MRWGALLAGVAVLALVAGPGRLEAQSAPEVPTIVSVGPGTGTLTVLWNPPSNAGVSPITAYDLRHIATDDDETDDTRWTVIEDVWVTGGGALSHQILDLEDGVGFDVQVRAVNANGDGPWSATSAGTTTDHGGTTAAATDLSLGSSLAGPLGTHTDEAGFEIALPSDGEVWIYATGLLDTVAELLDSSATVLKEADDGTHLDGPLGFEFRETLAAGTYYVRVSSYEDRAAGSYRIHAQTFTDPGSTFDTATEITLDSATPGRIGPRGVDPGATTRPGDADYFKLVLTASTDVWVMAYGTLDGDEDEVLDTEGRLYGADRNFLHYADDSEFTGNEEGFMLRRSLAAGTYYIRVDGFSAADVGPYTLHVRTATEPGSTTATATPLTLRVPETGRISSSSDRDYFSLTLDEDLYVFIYAIAFGPRQPLTPTILDDQNTEIPMHVISNANWREQGLGKIGFSAWGRLEAGTYHIRIAGASGRYLLDPLVSVYNRQLEDCTAITTPQSDPWYGCQWHLNNTDEFDDSAGQDINVESVWRGGNMGAGINVAIVDDGLEADHVDLVDNVVAARNHDFTGQGGVYDPLESHGTAVAGLVAARDNTIGVRGVAPRASIFAYNLIATGSSVLSNEASAMYKREDAAVTAVSNNSWGSVPTGLPIGARSTWERAVTRGVNEGYGGKGIAYVLSGGNGHEDVHNDSNLDGRANYYAVIAACAVAYDDRRSDYSEPGANLWVCAPSSSGRELQRITTTHIPDRYRDSFGGTSAAAPIVSGVVALMRAANADLTWRDVKLILAASARKNDAANAGWEEGAPEYGSAKHRYEFNHEYGFGMVDAAAAVALAGGWTNVPTMRTSEASSGRLRTSPGREGILLPDRDGATVTEVPFTLSLDSYVSFIEFVEVEIDLRHDYFRDLRIELESPSGVVSVLSVPALIRGRFNASHRFGSAKHLGESAEGTWTLRLGDYQTRHSGRLMSWRLKVYGHSHNPGRVEVNRPVAGAGALTVTWDAPTEIGSSAVTSYDIRYIADDAPDKSDANWTVVADVGSLSERTHTVTGLEGGKQYLVAVRAVNRDGNGPWVEGDVTETLAPEPGQPRSVSLVARNEALAVSWREPSYLGAGIATYDIWYIRDDAPDKADAFWSTRPGAWSTGSGELLYLISGLDNGVTNQEQVRAGNPQGAGP